MSKRKLLLADDSVTIQKVVNLTFADEGIDVISVGDGDTAMDRIAEVSPDVVLADVHMPGLSGYRICELLRDNPSTRNLPVVLLVGSFEPFDEVEAARVGANAYLTKPFQSIRQLVTQVTDLMESTVGPVSEQDVAEFVPEPEVPAEHAPAAEVPDATDIEALYHRSIAEPEAEHEEGETGPPRYVDAGMDDEMIETSYAGENGEIEIPGDEVAEEQFEDVYARSEFPEESPAFDAPGAEASAAAASATAMSEPEAHFDQFAATEQLLPIDTLPARENFGLDEVELLELPPIESEKTLEFTTTQSMMAQGGHKEIVSLSPELMEIIVQKVVERLSEKY